MNDDELERWINLEGPEPDEIRALLDAAFGPPQPTREQMERLDAKVLAAVAEDRRRRARRRTLKRGLGGGLAAACLAAAIVLALRLATRSAPARPLPVQLCRVVEVPADTGRAATTARADEARALPAPSGSATAGSAGPVPGFGREPPRPVSDAP